MEPTTLKDELAHFTGTPGFSHDTRQAALEFGLERQRQRELRRGTDDPRPPGPVIRGLQAPG